MKILSISGRNIASLEGDFVIDFTAEPLLSAGIFAITGPTGAGKSSILDTLCLALYGQTPRHNLAKESDVRILDVSDSKVTPNDVRTILRKGTSEGYAEVVFKGQDNATYKAVWAIRRARGKAEGSLQGYTVGLTNLSTNTPFGGTRTEILAEIERLAGLNFEQFTRSVLLAQGEFTAFLKADKNSKAELLEKLTGTDIYSEISKKVYEKYKIAEENWKDLNKKSGDILLLDSDELERIQAERTAFASELTDLNLEKEKIKKETDWHSRLDELQKSLAESENDFNRSKAIKEEAQPRIDHFETVESVQAAKVLFENKQAAKQLLELKTGEEQEIGKSLETRSAVYLDLEKQLNHLSENLASLEKEFESAKPDIEQAKRLDTLLESKVSGVVEAEKAVQLIALKSRSLESAIQDKTNEWTEISTKLSKLKEWFETNDSRKEIALKEPLILSKLRDAAALFQSQKTLTENLNKETGKGKDYEKDLGELNGRVNEIKEKVNSISLTIAERQKQFGLQNIQQMEQDELQFAEKIKELSSAKILWETLSELESQHSKTKKSVNDAEKSLTDSQNELIAQKGNLELSFAKKETAESGLTKAQIRSAENVESLRQHLKQGEECPVCGSKEHFYADHDSFSGLLGDLEKEVKILRVEYDEALKAVSKLEQQIENTSAEKEKHSIEFISIKEKLNSANEAWESFPKDEQLLKIEPEKRSEWLKNEIDKSIAGAESVKAKIKAHHTEKESISKLKDDLEKEKVKAEDLTKLKAELNQSLALSNQSIQTFQQELKGNIDRVDELLSELNPLFNQPEWSDKWKQNPTTFIDTIIGFARAWNENRDSLDQYNKRFELLKAEIDSLQKQFSDHKKTEKETLEKLSILSLAFNKLTKDRKELFGGKSVLEVENLYSDRISNYSKERSGAQTGANELKVKISTETGRLNQVKSDIKIQEKHLGTSLAALENWLRDYNSGKQKQLNEEELQHLLSFSSAWIASERSALKEFDNAILKAESTLKERGNQHNLHLANKISDRSLTELSLQLDLVTQSFETKEKLKNEIDFRLKQDAENKKQSAKLLIEIAAKNEIYEKWAKLNDIIGSADGKKFRQIAQEYTLEVLLGYANVHLQDLAPRYKLECIPDSLSLQVLYLDMGNEIRSVHSLSGGESFLVSLALALGLASLSSNKMKVESLFIDEGFGSLDPLTLSIAMDALEKLHHQGRKVGVISHVQELTERINTQIKVVKLSSGRSKVETQFVMNS